MTDKKVLTRTPWHLWAVGIFMTVWNSGGCFDYFMTQTRNADYLAQYSNEQLDYFASFPAWLDAAWAIGVWGAMAASILLLCRSRFALYAYMASLAGLIISSLYNYTSGANLEMMGGLMGLMFTGAIYILALAQLYYAKRMVSAGVLR